MSYDLTTVSFLNSFWRMTDRRGIPSYVVSDNGRNFVKGNKEIQILVQALDKNEILKESSFKGIQWTFNPPYSPHFGGVFEIMIKAAKRSIHAQLKNADVTDEEFTTILTGTEALINSRPITYQSANAKDVLSLTPNHFLIGQMGGELAPEIDRTTLANPTKRWRRIQEILKHFWKRWMREWIPALGQRRKWQKETPDLKTDDSLLNCNLLGFCPTLFFSDFRPTLD